MDLKDKLIVAAILIACLLLTLVALGQLWLAYHLAPLMIDPARP